MAKKGAFWDKLPTEFMTTVKASTRERAIDIAKTILQDVWSHSPVDTGSFQQSWRISANTPIFEFNGIRGGSVGTPFSFPAKFDKLFVTNGAPYAVPLEYGWSDKAPTGVLRNAIARIK